ncbi:hypothetical protein ABZP36_021483 [Zizania latifolia]
MAPSSSSAGPSASMPRPPSLQQQRGVAAAVAASPVFLNVYDITPTNGYARRLVHGVEYAYGAHDGAGSGIFEVASRWCPGYTFREAVLVETAEITRTEVRALMAELAAEFPGDAYNIISRNCNHFCDAACRRLVRVCIPPWVNRLAKIGVVFTCVIPGSGKPVRHKVEPSEKGRPASAAAPRNRPRRPPRRREPVHSSASSLSVGGGSKNVTP